jgi:hypothetical protein
MAKKYPSPFYGGIIEPFAGSACYSLHYPHLDVTLCDADPVISGIWRYLIGVNESEILGLPDIVENVDHIPGVAQEARWLIGFWLNSGSSIPCKTMSKWARGHAGTGHWQMSFWSRPLKERIAGQLQRIRHWKIIEGYYTSLDNYLATWFIDPPYYGKPGSHYRFGSHLLDYTLLGDWSKERAGLKIVCEAEGASWLPFENFGSTKAAKNRSSAEAVWISDNGPV